MEIWKNVEIWGKIWKFGGNLEILRIFGNLEKIEIWEKIRNFRYFFLKSEKKLETWIKFGNLENIWKQFGNLENF